MAKVDLSIMISAIDQASSTFAKIGMNAKQTWSNIGKSIEDANNKTRDMVNGLNDVGSKMAVVGASIMGVGYAGVTASMELEGYRAKLEVAMKDTKKAADMYEWAKETAKKTPFEMKSVVDAVVRLQMYGLEAKEWFGMVGNMAGAMGKDVTQAVEAVADAVSGGGLERLKEFGITGSMLKDAGWSGGYQTVEDINSLKAALQSVMTERFGGGMDKMMGTAAGAVSNFKDAIFNLRAAIGDALLPILKAITPWIIKFTDFLTSISKSPAGKVLNVLTIAFGALLLVGGGVLIFIAQAIMAWNTLTGALTRNAAAATAAGAANAAAGAEAAAGGAAAATGGIRGFFIKLLTWIKNLWPAIVTFFTAGMASLIPAIGSALASIGTAIAGAVAAIGAFIAGLPALVVAAIIAAIVAVGVGIWQLVKHWDTVKAWFAKVGESILDFFNSIPEKLYNAGKAAIDAFKNGILAGWNAVKNTINKLFGGGGADEGNKKGQAAFGGYRAAGGAVRAGMAYVVGENGPELFMPGANGSIVPNGMAAKMAAISGGGGGIDITLHTDGSFSVLTSGGLQDAVVRVVNDMKLQPVRAY